ncbi:MAG: isoprenylcysteine carboxylmethyltransferase family protein [Mariprofundaceae bacterium]|nr:isoprenylcysteine carboxylmethyltransferase family protein [Mariprofundaceae bacterium]
MISLPVWISSLLFALIHSLFAAEWCKTLFYQYDMTPHRYRLLYSLFAVVLTSLWLFYIYQLPDTPLYQVKGWPSVLLLVIQLSGLWVVLLSLKSFDTALFLGIKPMTGGREPFHEYGIYHHIRHPMYSGFILILFASPVQSVNSLNLAIAVALYFLIGSRFEERRMLLMHPEYADYQKRVPAFVPWRALFRGPRGPQ